MSKEKELHNIVYHVLDMQIKFGVYREGERLPTIEQAGKFLLVSADTVRAAYLRLKKEGIITLVKSSGACVKARYSEKQISANVQTYFSHRHEALADLSKSTKLLFSHAQWIGFKSATPEQLDEIEKVALDGGVLPPYKMAQHLGQVYNAHHNGLLMRLVWQVFMFYQAPFISIPDNIKMFQNGNTPLFYMLDLARKGEWRALGQAIDRFETGLSNALEIYFDRDSAMGPAGGEPMFEWSIFEKASQLCYSLSMSFMIDISRGVYPVGDFLPSAEKLAEQKGVSQSTIRRTLSLLRLLGVVKGVNGVGTKVLPLQECDNYCKFDHPVIQKLLMSYAESLQIFAMSCADVAKAVLSNLKEGDIEIWTEEFERLRSTNKHRFVIYFSLSLLGRFAPFKAVSAIYEKLLYLLLWGYPLQARYENLDDSKNIYAAFLVSMKDCLKRADADGFAEKVEELTILELSFVKERLKTMGYEEASVLLIPPKSKERNFD